MTFLFRDRRQGMHPLWRRFVTISVQLFRQVTRGTLGRVTRIRSYFFNRGRGVEFIAVLI